MDDIWSAGRKKNRERKGGSEFERWSGPVETGHGSAPARDFNSNEKHFPKPSCSYQAPGTVEEMLNTRGVDTVDTFIDLTDRCKWFQCHRASRDNIHTSRCHFPCLTCKPGLYSFRCTVFNTSFKCCIWAVTTGMIEWVFLDVCTNTSRNSTFQHVFLHIIYQAQLTGIFRIISHSFQQLMLAAI